MTDRLRDRVLAVLAAVLAATCIAAARAIEDSLLADAVGAGGVPQGVGIAMGLAALALFVKSYLGVAPQARLDAVVEATSRREIALRTGAMVAILLAYGAVLPIAGYALSVSLLVLASGRLAGAPFKAPLLLCAALAGPLLWALFDWLLQVRMPIGMLWT